MRSIGESAIEDIRNLFLPYVHHNHDASTLAVGYVLSCKHDLGRLVLLNFGTRMMLVLVKLVRDHILRRSRASSETVVSILGHI